MGVHAGHRQRVKEKFEKNGFDSFADHEVLEALLFYAIPYRDTNPVAHALIDRAGVLGRVPLMKPEHIASTPGCGERTAAFLDLFAELGYRSFIERNEAPRYDTPEALRALAKEIVAGKAEEITYLVLLDNCFSVIDSLPVFRGYYASAAFRAALVAEPALHAHASMAMLVSLHTNRIARADPYETETTRYLASSLSAVGVRLIEHYVVGGSLCMPVMHRLGELRLSPADNVISAPCSHASCMDDQNTVNAAAPLRSHGVALSLSDSELLADLFSHLMPAKPREYAVRLLSQYGSLSGVMHADPQELSEAGLSSHAVSMLRILLPAYGRCMRSFYPVGIRFSGIEEIGHFFTTCFCGMDVETVYLLLLRADMTYIDCRRFAVGSINSANLNIRTMVEAALFSGARHVVLAHNHPGGSTQPSESDLTTTSNLRNAFETIGVNFLDHIIVAGNRYIPIFLAPNQLLQESEQKIY